ncbi:hypothetical protein [Desulfovibrio ferrophilus]|uniref:Uncharacterized protein n=1 Tax=Desulfovibrio ferrophilus TaxID=241368 RepID=A0A2Z6AX63_9BACT|nr:hypothetical protein [Desulfovibrio ferrophilus]BBD07795.1 putative uncharacterized protein [Desulfovibrio ferrophilus]
MGDSFYADWMTDCLVPDEAFSLAYNAMPGMRRAWIKKTAAQVHALIGPMRDRREDKCIAHRQGFSSHGVSAPMDCAVIFLDSTCVSPVQVAAAAVPLVLSGAKRMCAVRIEDGLAVSDDVLAALELVGLETVFQLSEPEARRFMERLTETRSAAVLFFGQGTALNSLAVAAGYAAPPLKLFKPFVTERLGIWAGAGGDWDYETLAWAHPCTMFDIWGARESLPDLPLNFSRKRGSFESFLREGYRALYVPEARLMESVGRAALALGPGQEGCWACPELTTDFFRAETLAIGGWNE